MEYVYGFLGYDMARQLMLLLYSLILGAVLGGVFDILRITRVFLAYRGDGHGMRAASDTVLCIVSFIEDIAFALFSAAALILFCFKANNGSSRGYILFGTLIGFALYLATVGRLTQLISNKLSQLLYRLFAFLKRRLILPAAAFIRGTVLKAYSNTLGRAAAAVRHRVYINNTKKTSRELALRIAGLYIDVRKDNGDETNSPANAGEARDIRSIHNNDNHPRRNTDRVQSARRRTNKTA